MYETCGFSNLSFLPRRNPDSKKSCDEGGAAISHTAGIKGKIKGEIMPETDYDLIIAGGGPAGLTAGLYAGRAMLKSLLLERMILGGQAASTFLIENYPGFPEGIPGPELSQAMEKQARNFGLIIENGEINALQGVGKFWEIETGGRIIRSKAIIVATGVEPNKLGVPGEEELKGRGVSYCATCDGPFFRNQEIAVVGGGDSAVDEAIYLTRFASKVYLIHRRNALRAEKILQDRAFKNSKIEILWDTVVIEVLGRNGVDSLKIRNVKTEAMRDLKVGGVFFYVGWQPLTGFLKGIVPLDAAGYILTDANLTTSAPGIFAAGDVRQKILRQVATAVGDGAIAAFSAEKYIEALE
jgi:thioredoxin reductase (NADPH)